MIIFILFCNRMVFYKENLIPQQIYKLYFNQTNKYKATNLSSDQL